MAYHANSVRSLQANRISLWGIAEQYHCPKGNITLCKSKEYHLSKQKRESFAKLLPHNSLFCFFHRFHSSAENSLFLMRFIWQSLITHEILDLACLDNPCANGTSRAVEFCPRVNVRLPYMVIGATPPHPFVAAKCHVRRLQLPVQGLIPFTCQHWL